jgi:hypothetical protein
MIVIQPTHNKDSKSGFNIQKINTSRCYGEAHNCTFRTLKIKYFCEVQLDKTSEILKYVNNKTGANPTTFEFTCAFFKAEGNNFCFQTH